MHGITLCECTKHAPLTRRSPPSHHQGQPHHARDRLAHLVPSRNHTTRLCTCRHHPASPSPSSARANPESCTHLHACPSPHTPVPTWPPHTSIALPFTSTLRAHEDERARVPPATSHQPPANLPIGPTEVVTRLKGISNVSRAQTLSSALILSRPSSCQRSYGGAARKASPSCAVVSAFSSAQASSAPRQQCPRSPRRARVVLRACLHLFLWSPFPSPLASAACAPPTRAG